MISQELFNAIFQMGYDHAKRNRKMKMFRSDELPRLTPNDYEDGWRRFQDYDWGEDIRTIETEIDGIEPFETGELAFTVQTTQTGLNEICCDIDIVSFIAEADVDSDHFDLKLEADFTDQ